MSEAAAAGAAAVPADLVERCRRIPTSTWSDALDLLGLSGVLTGLRRRAGELPVAGPALTVAEELGPLGSASADEFRIELILAAARPGDLVVIRQSGRPPASALGGLAALAGREFGLAGVVVDGACRDLTELEEVGLPVLSRSVTPASGRGRVRITGLNGLLRLGEVETRAGDIVVADETGVVVLPAARLDALLPLAEERERDDAERGRALRERGARHT